MMTWLLAAVACWRAGLVVGTFRVGLTGNPINLLSRIKNETANGFSNRQMRRGIVNVGHVHVLLRGCALQRIKLGDERASSGE